MSNVMYGYTMFNTDFMGVAGNMYLNNHSSNIGKRIIPQSIQHDATVLDTDIRSHGFNMPFTQRIGRDYSV